jgi:UDP-glucose 4-epimerase
MIGKSMLITGGAGFIGSHLVDALMTRRAEVSVFDNLSSGTLQNIKQWLGNPNFTLIKGNLLNPSDLKKLSHKRYDIVFHLAANPEVRVGSTNPNIHFQQNLAATHNLLEHNRKTPTLIFTSTSTVYGEPTKIPTPENYAPLKPVSVYGATKLASEALITAYAYTYDFKAIILRLANIVGPRSRHGVVHDFIQKLRKNPNKLEILGDGTQTKSYLYMSDCINAMFLTLQKTTEQVSIYNVGSEDQITVKEIAQIVTQETGLKNVKFTYTGGVDGGRGWKGDVKNMLLDVTKLKGLGWDPKLNSAGAIRQATKYLISKEI